MGMKQSAFDQWLTTQKESGLMLFVSTADMTDEVNGMADPQCVDELRCDECAAPVGWCSSGSFTDFFTDQSDQHKLCADCHDNLESTEQ